MVLLAAGLCLALQGCASSPEPRTTNEPPAAPRLDLPPFAATKVEADVEAVPALTSAFREAVARTSGVHVVDQVQVESALVACGEPPCATELTDVYSSAPIVVSASVAKAGEGSHLGMARALEGARVLKRGTASGDDPLEVVRRLGWELGAAVRAELLARGDVDKEP